MEHSIFSNHMDDPDHKSASQCYVKNICISDVETGIIVFQKVYKWKESSAFFNLGGLIQVFYQFAREVDDGEISCVNFESGRKINTRLSDQPQASRNQTMQMKSIKTEDIIVSVFFDMQGTDMPTWEEDLKLDVLMHAVKEAFLKDNLLLLRQKRPTLQHEMEEQNQMLANEDTDARLSLPFDEFAAVADQLRHQLFPLQDHWHSDISADEDVILDENISLEEHVQMQLAYVQYV
jgi:hypothetical protein